MGHHGIALAVAERDHVDRRDQRLIGDHHDEAHHGIAACLGHRLMEGDLKRAEILVRNLAVVAFQKRRADPLHARNAIDLRMRLDHHQPHPRQHRPDMNKIVAIPRPKTAPATDRYILAFSNGPLFIGT